MKVWDVLANKSNLEIKVVTHVLALRGVAALDITQRWVRLDDACRHQVVQAQKILIVAQTIKIPPAEG